MEKTVGIAREQSLPTSHRESPENWFKARGGAHAPEVEVTDKVLLFPDSYANYNHPDTGKVTVHILETTGVHASVPDDVTATGRPTCSKGFLDRSQTRAETSVDTLTPRVETGWSIMFVEPSDAVMPQPDYLDLLSSKNAECVAAKTHGIMEYLDAERLVEDLDHDASTGADDETLMYHGHCHQKVTWKDYHTVGVLRRTDCDVDPLDSGYYGMTGSFGYEAKHRLLSTAIDGILADQISGNRGNTIIVPGASYRAQLGDMGDTADGPPHPIEKVSEVITD